MEIVQKHEETLTPWSLTSSARRRLRAQPPSFLAGVGECAAVRTLALFTDPVLLLLARIIPSG